MVSRFDLNPQLRIRSVLRKLGQQSKQLDLALLGPRFGPQVLKQRRDVSVAQPVRSLRDPLANERVVQRFMEGPAVKRHERVAHRVLRIWIGRFLWMFEFFPAFAERFGNRRPGLRIACRLAVADPLHEVVELCRLHRC